MEVVINICVGVVLAKCLKLEKLLLYWRFLFSKQKWGNK